MKTNGGFKIKNFKELKKPIKHGALEPHIYEGLVKNVPTIGDKKEDYLITWDKFGRCANWNRSDCFINVKEIKS